MRHKVSDLIDIFDDLFSATESTCLRCGGSEPNYLPAAAPGEKSQVLFAHGFFASALHEIAHWCIAGRQRRLLPDYGYWYQPDGRSPEQQRQFAQVEARPQALEWVFSVAAGSTFNFSADNLAAGGVEASPDWLAFQRDVVAQARHYVTTRLPGRAALLAHRLSLFYATNDLWQNPESYNLR